MVARFELSDSAAAATRSQRKVAAPSQRALQPTKARVGAHGGSGRPLAADPKVAIPLPDDDGGGDGAEDTAVLQEEF